MSKDQTKQLHLELKQKLFSALCPHLAVDTKPSQKTSPVLLFFFLNKRAFSACLAVSPFLVVPILYDSELNSLSLPTLPQHKSLRNIFLTSEIESEITLSLRPSTRTACLPDKLWSL